MFGLKYGRVDVVAQRAFLHAYTLLVDGYDNILWAKRSRNRIS